MNPEFGGRKSASPERPGTYFDVHVLDGLGVRMVNLVTDSRAVKPGDTFLAYPGEEADGRDFIPHAIAAGANAVLWERCGFVWDHAWRLPNLAIEKLQSSAGLIADSVYGHPSRKLSLIGITGTNGKTSCSHWIAHAMNALGRKTALIGTLGAGFPGALELTANTTPGAVLLHQKIADFVRDGAQFVTMEVSSHGISQERINGATFAVALLTNLSRDHLDYHGSMETYAAAKARLFHWPGLRCAVLNLDDAFGAGLAQQLSGTGTQIIGYGLTEQAVRIAHSGKFEVVHGRNLKTSAQGLTFDIEFETGYDTEHSEFKSEVVGGFNASNLLGSLATLLASGIKLSDAAQALQQVRPVAGRMQQLGGGEQPLVVVDYAHTPDALEKVLVALREILHAASEAGAETGAGSPRLICVFGCGGERDQGKRPLLGAVATRLADEVIITSDNPRTENPNVIIDQITAGAGANCHIEEDRAAAILRAIQGAHKGDVVLIAGKGHEAYQEVGGKKLPFRDDDVALEILRNLTDRAATQA